MAKKLIRACSVSMVTDLLKVLFSSFFFKHIFAQYLIFFVLYMLIIDQGDMMADSSSPKITGESVLSGCGKLSGIHHITLI